MKKRIVHGQSQRSMGQTDWVVSELQDAATNLGRSIDAAIEVAFALIAARTFRPDTVGTAAETTLSFCTTAPGCQSATRIATAGWMAAACDAGTEVAAREASTGTMAMTARPSQGTVNGSWVSPNASELIIS